MKNISWIYTIKYCLNSAWKTSKPYTIARIVIKMLIPIITLIASYITANITNALAGQTTNDSPENFFLFLMMSLVCVRILSMILSKIHMYIAFNHNELLERDINLNIMDICTNSDIEMYDNPQYYDNLDLAKRDSQAIVNILWSVLDFTSAMLSFLSVFIIICGNELLIAIIITLGTIPAAIISHYFTGKNYTLGVEQINEEREKYYYSGISSEKVYSQIIRINNLGDWIKRKYQGIWQKLFLQRKVLYRKTYILDTIVKVIPELVIVGALINIGTKVIAGEYLIGYYALYTGLFSQLYAQIVLTIENAMNIYDNKMKIENILTFNHVPHTIISGELPLGIIDTIEFKDVSFKYPASKMDVLNSISFIIEKGEKVALVGVNGSGKSTILKLMLRFYDPTCGHILINGQDIKEYEIKDLRACIDCYFQNSINLPFSIRKNVNMRNDEQCNVDDMAIASAMELACANDVLHQSHNNLSTHISRLFSKTGIELSEGQHQKIAISRVFYNKMQLVIFDEPSSSLDPEAEDTIFKSIKETFEGKTVFFTSHRLTNLNLADKIIVLEDGKIIENGTKDELLSNRGRFYSLYQYQSEKFAVDKY